MVKIDSLLLLQGMVQLDSFSFAYGIGRPDSSLSTLDFVSSDSPVPSKTFVCPGPMLLVFGIACLEDFLLVLDFVSLDSVLPLRRSA